MAEPETLYQITAPHFVAAIVVRGGQIVDAAPILRWAIGKRCADTLDFFRKKHYQIRDVTTLVKKSENTD